ncbi:MAG: penicillin-binding protein 2 [Candidatus Moranbacteria bacterium]|nr:penicillin-binding protein 2 [Candidatus Moranbacteria bacterium]
MFTTRRTHTIKRMAGNEIDDAVLTMTEKDAAKIEWPINRMWLPVFWWVSVLVLGVLCGRVFFLNVVKGAYYQDIAKRNSVRSIVIPAPRGGIYDRFGKVLVNNTPSVDLIAIPADFPQEEGARLAEVAALQDIFSFTPEEQEEMLSKIKGKSILPVPIKEQLTQEEVLIFSSKSRDFPGVSLLKSATRNYVDSLIFSHIIGYEGRIRKEELDQHPDYLLTDSIGKQGVEKSYEQYLRGTHGAHQVEVDAVGKVQKELGIIAPAAGDDLILNIDADLQKKIFDVLQSQLETSGLTKGVVIALDPRTGAVLALVSYPSFDNNLFAGGIDAESYKNLLEDPANPLFNRAVSGEYPPGSTIKPILAGAALNEGVIDEDTQIESRGGIQLGSFFFGDWKVHGFTDVRQAIAVSSDVFFYSVGGGYGSIRGMGMEIMKKYDNLFGLGEKTGIDIPGEADGFIPDPGWKKEKIGERWYIGDDYHASIGQGFVLATPLQMINAIAAIANGGTLYTPHIVSQIKSADGEVTTIAPKVIRDHLLRDHILQVVREGMRKTVTEGTATTLSDLPIQVAGKTGTAEFGSDKKTQGWFEVFAPYDNPEIAMIVLTEGQEEHGYNAVPISKEILGWYFGEHKR